MEANAVPPRWLLLHIPLFILSYVLLIAGAAFAILFITQERRIKQHQAVYAALGGRVGEELHALQLETAVPADPEPLPETNSE